MHEFCLRELTPMPSVLQVRFSVFKTSPFLFFEIKKKTGELPCVQTRQLRMNSVKNLYPNFTCVNGLFGKL